MVMIEFIITYPFCIATGSLQYLIANILLPSLVASLLPINIFTPKSNPGP